MSDVRILVIDDENKWRETIQDVLKQHLGRGLQVDVANSYPEALQKVRITRYDLVSVDLKLLGEISEAANPELPGMDLLKECRSSSLNRGCGLIVLSAYATPRAVYSALKHYGVNVFLDKADFGVGGLYVEAAQNSIRLARLAQARHHQTNRFQLTLTYNENGLIHGELTGPNHRSEGHVDCPVPAGLDGLARRANELNLRLDAGGGEWREEARSIGTAVYRTLVEHQPILSLLSAAQAFTSSSDASSLALQFSGPPACLSVPFELMRDEDEYFAVKHVLTRRLSRGGARYTRKFDPFFRFVEKLIDQG
jgi:CheY-like chemotaxis protein